MSTKPFDAIDINVPLVVDLDGTLSKTDTLHEGIVSILFKKPIKIIGLTRALFDGKTGRDADLVVMIDRQIPSDDLIVHFF